MTCDRKPTSLCPMNRRQLLLGALTSSATAFGFPQIVRARVGKLRAGAAAYNITPSLGCSLAGSMRDRIADEVHDELQVRSLVLDNGSARLALAVVDSCVVPRKIIDRAKESISEQTGIPASHVLVSATHTHSAPPADHLFQSEPDPAYQDWLSVRIADAVRLAVNRLQPARIGWGVGREDRLVFNRRFFMKPGTIPPDPLGGTTDKVRMNPPRASSDILRAAGPTDPEVGILAVESLDGRPISVLGSYALHYVGPGASTHITADYFGEWSNTMTRIAGVRPSQRFPPFVPILTNACSGNINGINFSKPAVSHPPYAEMRRYADILAAESYRTWRSLDYHDSVDLDAYVEEIELGVRLPTAADVAQARKTLAGAPKEGNYSDRAQIYARETFIMSETFAPTVKTFVQTMRIGDLGIATFPGEAFVELGLEVKQKSPFKTQFLIELANDYRGYIPTVEGHEHGGYETWRAKSSFLEPHAAPKMVASALRQLEKLV